MGKEASLPAPSQARRRAVTGRGPAVTSGDPRYIPAMPNPPLPAAKPPGDFWNQHLPWRRPIEIGGWLLAFVGGAVANVMVRVIDASRDGDIPETWKYAAWEGSSALSSLALLPALLWLCQRWPLHADNLPWRLPAYLLASGAWSVAHVVLMVALRILVYAWFGEHYDFDWAIGLPYEYLKDGRTFALVVLVTHGYHWLWRRLQGEARVLDAPDPGVSRAAPGEPERFLVRKLGREFLVSVADIEWVQASGNYVNLRVAGRDYPLRSTMAAIEARLESAGFVRVHRSCLVNLAFLESIQPQDSGDARLRMKSGEEVPCSRRYRERLRDWATLPPRGDLARG